MAILHKNISAEGDIHNPKWFSGANNGDVAWRNELGVLESTDELVLPAALNFVDGSVSPPTSNSGDIYVLSSGGSVNAGWGTVALGDWVRYDGTDWNEITPQKSTLCYNEDDDSLYSYDGSTWNGVGGGGDSIYTADGTLTGNRTVDLDGNDLSFEGNSGLNINNTSVNNSKALISLSKGMSNNSTRSTYIEGYQDGEITNYWKIFQKGSSNFGDDNGIGFYRNIYATQGTEYGMTGISAVNSALYIANYTDSAPRMQFFGGTTNVTGNGYLKFRNYSATTDNINIARSGKNFINPDSVGGFSDAGFIVMGDTCISTETISLQGQTAIKGNGTSTGSALSIYDNDTTPNKLWDFLDNGTLNGNKSKTTLIAQNNTSNNLAEYIARFRNNLDSANYGIIANDGYFSFGTNNTILNTDFSTCFQLGHFNSINTTSAYFGVIGKSNAITGNGNYRYIVGSGNNTLSGNEQVILGVDNNVSSNFASMIGSEGVLSGTYGVAIGRAHNVTSQFSVALGAWTKPSASGASVIGHGVESDKNQKLENSTANSLALGWNTTTPQHLFKSDGVNLTLPTSATGLSSGDLWNDGGTVKIA